MKEAKIVKKANGTKWELRAGRNGKGKVLHLCVGVIMNQPKSTEHASDCLYAEAERQGYKIISEWDI